MIPSYQFIRLFFILLSVFGVVVRLIIQVVEEHSIYNLGYFTILSNLACLVYLVFGLNFRAKNLGSHPFSVYIHTAITLYISATGLIYNTILFEGYDLTIFSLMSFVNHVVMPVFFFVDWIITSKRTFMSFPKTLYFYIFPLAYSAFAFIEGSITHTYRYPFLDISKPIEKFLPFFLAMIAGFVLFGTILWLIHRFLITKIYKLSK